MALPTITSIASASPKSNENFVATKIFINQVPEYQKLPSCAENEVSSVVRNMVYGCGDGSRMTSYACFCYSSSTRFTGIITSRIQNACGSLEQASMAGDVFGKYCQIGLTQGFPTPSALASPTTQVSQVMTILTPSSLAFVTSNDSTLSSQTLSTVNLPLSTPTSMTSAASHPSNSKTKSTTIAVSVAIPVLALSFGIAIFLIFMNRKKKAAKSKAGDEGGERWHNVSSTRDGKPCGELAARDEKSYHVAELPDQKDRQGVAELDVHGGQPGIAELHGDGFR